MRSCHNTGMKSGGAFLCKYHHLVHSPDLNPLDFVSWDELPVMWQQRFRRPAHPQRLHQETMAGAFTPISYPQSISEPFPAAYVLHFPFPDWNDLLPGLDPLTSSDIVLSLCSKILNKSVLRFPANSSCLLLCRKFSHKVSHLGFMWPLK